MLTKKWFPILAIGLGSVVLSGCVMSEKYEAEKARGLNFQRLLAQEEKRTAELDAELKKARRQATEMESRSRELMSELQMSREQLARTQEDAMTFKETAALGEKAGKNFGGSMDDQLSIFGLDEPAFTGEGGIPIYHEVVPGDTLFRLSRNYGAKVNQIREWNGIRDDLIEVGQQLVVGYQ